LPGSLDLKDFSYKTTFNTIVFKKHAFSSLIVDISQVREQDERRGMQREDSGPQCALPTVLGLFKDCTSNHVWIMNCPGTTPERTPGGAYRKRVSNYNFLAMKFTARMHRYC
jgi:hypothetical protein